MPETTRDGEPPREPPPSPESVDLGPEGSSAGLGELTEAELLGLMSTQHTNPTAARDAWGEMYLRHVRYLFLLVSRSYGDTLGGADQVSDVVVDAFQAAYDWAGRQSSPEDVEARFHDPDGDRIRRRVLGWLTVIARRLAARRITTHSEGSVQLHEQFASEVSDGEPPSTNLRTLLARALEKLSPEEIEALRASMPWYEPETGEFAFPRGEAHRIASSLGLTADALRQRRHRTLKRLESLLRTDGAKVPRHDE